MKRTWEERMAQMPSGGRALPGAGETIACIWQGVGRITKSDCSAQVSDLTARFPVFPEQAQYTLENLADHARRLVTEDQGHAAGTGFVLLDQVLLEPFRVLAEQERKDAE